MNDQEWEEVREIFESRGVSRKVADARPYQPYRRGEAWVYSGAQLWIGGRCIVGPFNTIPATQRAVTITRDVRGADGLVMYKHPVPLSNRKLMEFPPQLRPTLDPRTGSIVNHDHDDPWISRVARREHVRDHHGGDDVVGLHDNFRPEYHRHADMTLLAREEHVAGHWHHRQEVDLHWEHPDEEPGKYKLPPSPLVNEIWEHEHPVRLPRGGCQHRPPCRTDEEHHARHLKKKKHPQGEEGYHAHPVRDKVRENTYGLRFDVHPMAVPLLRDAEVVFVSMEGNLKADAILTYILKHEQPWAVVDIPSVGMWHAPELVDLAREHLDGRQVFLVCDSDWAHPSKRDVQRQAFAFREYLRRELRTKYRVQVASPEVDELDEWGEPVKVGVDDWLAEEEHGGYGGALEDLVVVEREVSPRTRRWTEVHREKTSRDRPSGDQRNSKTEARLLELMTLVTPEGGRGSASVSSLAAFTSLTRETVADGLPTLRWQALGDDQPLEELDRHEPRRGYSYRTRVKFDVDDDPRLRVEEDLFSAEQETWTWVVRDGFRWHDRRPRRTIGDLAAQSRSSVRGNEELSVIGNTTEDALKGNQARVIRHREHPGTAQAQPERSPPRQ